MSNFDNLMNQLKMVRDANQNLENLNNVFNQTIKEAEKNLPDDKKGLLQDVKALNEKVISLTKQGKLAEAQSLIKQFSDGSFNY